MSEPVTSPIQIEGDKIRVADFQTSDSDIVQYFRDIDDEQRRHDQFEAALRAGVLALQSAETPSKSITWKSGSSSWTGSSSNE